MLDEGDVYCMSEKTVGTDWMTAPKKHYTLRHAAGSEKYTTKTDKIWIKNQRPWSDKDRPVKDVTVGDIWYKPKKSKTIPNPEWTEMSNFCS